MKTKTILLLATALILGLTGVLSSQNKKGTFVFTMGTAHSLAVPIIPKAIEAAAQGYTTNTSVKAYTQPGVNFSADLFLSRWLSIGGAFTYQKCSAEFTGHHYVRASKEYIENCNFNISRSNIGFRALLHHTKGRRFDLYNGFRIGYSTWNVSLDSKDANINIPKQNGNGLSYQVILIGMKGYLDKHGNFGVGAEAGIGSPYFASVFLSARF
jgi:hypothetical protein